MARAPSKDARKKEPCRKDCRRLLRGRGLVHDGDLAADMLKNWARLEQVYHVKVKGMLTLADLERLGKEIDAKMQTVRQPDATRGRAANYWYEVRMRDSKKEELRRALFKEKHPVEKLKRISLGPRPA